MRTNFISWARRALAVGFACLASALAHAQEPLGLLEPEQAPPRQGDRYDRHDPYRYEETVAETEAGVQATPAAAGYWSEAQIRELVAAALAEAEAKAEPKEEFFEVGKQLDFHAVWRHGLWLETEDKAFKFHPGGRVQFDTIWMNGENSLENESGGTGPIRDGVNFRRARFAMEGSFWEVFEFNTEWDFINTFDFEPLNGPVQTDVANVPAPTDLWIQITQLPGVGTFRAGNMKPPISLEHITSSRFLPFLERSPAFDAFVGGLDNGFKPGFMCFNAFDNDNGTWAIGAFKNNTTVMGWNQGDGEWDLTGRLTYTPYYEDEGRHMVHLGLGATVRDLDEDRVRLRARVPLRNGPGAQQPALLNLLIAGDDQMMIVPEFAMQWGRWTVQSEYYAVWVTDGAFPASGPPVATGDAFFQSAYVQALYFLTGEHTSYNRKGGSGSCFARVIPHSNFFLVRDVCGGCCLGRGAWQVGARYSWLDLRDAGFDGGLLHDWTLGLNWYMNPNLKWQWNYVATQREVSGPADGWVHGVGMRVAFDF
jgi:phosphate-selective porin OprO/OprP